ncbi:hypothetical protein [Roseibium marinum]|uniref:hypothetical protein n=1 Tax=Roseibium marinum TaxID=281252 RepID=UPI000CD2B5CC|nr:hypothetical protein [Roseibium marinum]
MSSEKSRRAPRGQSRLEFRSKKETIAVTAKECPNLLQLWKRLKGEGVVTIGYSTFCNVYREAFPQEYAAMRSARKQDETAAPAQAKPQPQAKARKPLPEISKFTVPTGSDAVRDQW